MPRILAAAMACFSLGCYVGAPMPTPRPAIGARVQLTLTDAGTVAMASQLGPSRVELAGYVAAATDSSLVLALRTVTDRRGIEETWLGEQVTVPQSAIAIISLRNVSAARSVLLAVVTVALSMAIGIAISGRSTGVDTGKDPGPAQ